MLSTVFSWFRRTPSAPTAPEGPRASVKAVVARLLDEGHAGEEIAAALIESAGNLAAAYTRREDQCEALVSDLSATMREHALITLQAVNAFEARRLH